MYQDPGLQLEGTYARRGDEEQDHITIYRNLTALSRFPLCPLRSPDPVRGQIVGSTISKELA